MMNVIKLVGPQMGIFITDFKNAITQMEAINFLEIQTLYRTDVIMYAGSSEASHVC